MIIKFVEIKNFRKLKACRIDFSEKETVFVGSNNSGKTSAMDALIFFLKDEKRLSTRDFTLSNWRELDKIGFEWDNLAAEQMPDFAIEKWQDYLPQLDVWLDVSDKEIHYVSNLIPTLEWKGGLLGVRLRFEPKDIEALYKDYTERSAASKKLREDKPDAVKLWPKTMWDFLERKLHGHFKVKAYILDPNKIQDVKDGIAQIQQLTQQALPLESDPFKGLIKIDIINAQRGFSDSNNDDDLPKVGSTLSAQLREYYTKHLDPYERPISEDLDALKAIEMAEKSFDDRLGEKFAPSIKELELLNYPGFGANPKIKISTKVKPMEGLNHASAVQFEVMRDDSSPEYSLNLPEKNNGLGYQNLISMVFKLIRFRDEWMQVGKLAKPVLEDTDADEFQPLHLVLVEEPEAHLHAQVQQVFIKKAYDVLRFHDVLKKHSHFKTQMVVSTHSNHIAHEIDFTSLRYFKRIKPERMNVPTSSVVNLSSTFGKGDDTSKFAIRYLRTTHCDLFFADAVILIEGSAERMLIPHFIRHHFESLDSCYIALLEIGGRHSHRLKPLLEQLSIPTLIITDLDTVDSTTQKTRPKIGAGVVSSNTTLNDWIPKKTLLDDLINLNDEQKELESYPFRVAYQTPIAVKLGDEKDETIVIPYTFEAALAFSNIELFKSLEGNGLIKKFSNALSLASTAEADQSIYNSLSGPSKAEFALELLYLQDPKSLVVPRYIAEGLTWLAKKLDTNSETIHPMTKGIQLDKAPAI